jgi:hypothetical protein
VTKRSKWIWVLPLIAAVVLAAAVPMADQPQTSFNEIDTPVNVTNPVSPFVKSELSLIFAATVLRLFGPMSERMVRTSVEPRFAAIHFPVSLPLEFLCAFRI